MTADTAISDGRAARRQRNIEAVLDVVIEMFAEEALFPTMEQVAKRSGLSLRSLYRYFADPSALLEATISRHYATTRRLAHLTAIGQGPLDKRIEDLVAMRLRLHEAIGPVYRATMANAAHHPRVRDRLALGRNEMRQQFLTHFAPEIDLLKNPERDALASAGDLLTQLESIDFLRRHHQLSVAETHTTVALSLRSLLERRP